MDALKAGQWIGYLEGAAAFGVTYSAFSARARTARLRTRIGEGAVLQVQLTGAFIAKFRPAAAVAKAGAAHLDVALLFETLAAGADAIANDLAEEAGEIRAEGDTRVAQAGLTAAVFMGCVALLLRAGADHLSPTHEDTTHV